MFPDPLLELGPGLVAGQFALHDLPVHGPPLRRELLGEGLLLGCRVGPETGTEPRPETGPCPEAETDTRSGGQTTRAHARPSDKSARVFHAGTNVHAAGASEAAHLELLETSRFETGQAIQAREHTGWHVDLSPCDTRRRS